jgi:hypothetical protein
LVKVTVIAVPAELDVTVPYQISMRLQLLLKLVTALLHVTPDWEIWLIWPPLVNAPTAQIKVLPWVGWLAKVTVIVVPELAVPLALPCTRVMVVVFKQPPS